MYPVLAHHIVLGTWVWEIIDLHIILDALSDQAETVLPYYDRIDRSLSYQQLAFQVLGLVYQTCPAVSFWVVVRMIHVPFSIHDFIPFPVYHGTSGYAYLEYVRIIGDE